MEQRIRNDGEIQIGANIKRIRKERNMRQTELLTALQIQGCNMTKDTLSRIERGVHHISARELATVKEILHTSYDELFKRINEISN